MNPSEEPLAAADARPRTVEELMSALHLKFSDNFATSKPKIGLASDVERRARALCAASDRLEERVGDSVHQRELAKCLHEVFGDLICAVYLSCCGMNVPARMLLRRSLELGLVVAAYWDSPVDYWNWREHDGDIRFTAICAHLRSDGFGTLCKRQTEVSEVDCGEVLKTLDTLYGELSNVVHPKLYNFSTAGANSYTFKDGDLDTTLSYATRVLSAISTLLSARFANLVSILHP